MPIALEFRDNIQFVILEGALSKAEEPQLKLKLDQKYTQGRKLFVIKLDLFNFDHAESIGSLQIVVSYLVSLGAWIGISGLNQKQVGLLQAIYQPHCKGFATEPEAKKWILEESVKTEDPSQKKKQTEEDIKRTEINHLIQSYVKHFIEKDMDPFRIVKLAYEYNLNPSPEFLHALRSLIAEKEKLEMEIQKKEAELDQAERILFEFMNIRKLPTSEAEILSHMKLAESKSGETDRSLKEIDDQIIKKTERLAQIKIETDSKHNAWKTRIENAEREVKNVRMKHENAAKEIARREQEETEQLEALKKGPPA